MSRIDSLRIYGLVTCFWDFNWDNNYTWSSKLHFVHKPPMSKLVTRGRVVLSYDAGAWLHGKWDDHHFTVLFCWGAIFQCANDNQFSHILLSHSCKIKREGWWQRPSMLQLSPWWWAPSLCCSCPACLHPLSYTTSTTVPNVLLSAVYWLLWSEWHALHIFQGASRIEHMELLWDIPSQSVANLACIENLTLSIFVFQN